METRGAAMSFTAAAAAGGFVVFLLCMPAVQGTTSTSFRVPPRLKIPFLSVRPSREIVEGSSVTLTCSSDAKPAASYTWFKKNALMLTHTLSNTPQLVFSSIQSSDSALYACEAENHLGTKRSEFYYVDVKYAPKHLSVSLSPSGDTMKGSSVTLTCSSDANPGASYTWYKENEDSPKESGHIFIITDFRDEDGGKYSCEAQNTIGRSNSTFHLNAARVRDKRRGVYSRDIYAYIGSTVSMYCYARNPTNALITKTFWFTKEVKKYPFDLTDDSDYRDRATNNCDRKNSCTLTITGLKHSDSKKYRCRFSAEGSGHKWTVEPGTTLTVRDFPSRPSVLVSPSGEIVKGSSVTLTCSANQAASAKWWKMSTYYDGELVAEGPHLVFPSIRSTDSGIIFCQAGSEYSDIISIDVKCCPKLKIPSVSVSPSGEIVVGSSVTLTCSSDANPAASYTWYKEDEDRNLKHLREEPQLVFSSIQSSDSGEYCCEAGNHLGTKRSEFISIDVKYAPKLPSVSVSPSGEIVEGSSVTLTCSSDANPAANYTWYKEDEKKPVSKEPQLVFSSIQSSDSGEYHCEAENHLGTKTSTKSISLDVKYAPRLPSVSVSPSGEIVEGSSVTLTCSSDAKPAASYTWYKENQPLLQGLQGVYGFTSISSEDRGIYYCKSENPHGEMNSPSLLLNVQYAPKLPSVSVRPSGDVMKGSSVTLTCSSDANPAASYTWYKEDEDSPKASGHIFTINVLRDEDSGNYSCEAQNTRGRSNSTFYLISVAENSTSMMMMIMIIWWTWVVLMLIPLLLLILWKRKKRTLSATPDPREPEEIELDSFPEYQNVSDIAAEPEDTEEQEDWD